ncbi:hypothetical protein V1358_00095 [Pseudoalteromonas sp. YIC-656]|uniref:hypothetical protein n=1 Tax=Pseudoalteromonas pernae TaxID=3118054 RepID=UPI0032425D6E
MYNYSCANGSYQLTLQGSVIIGEFNGAINDRMIATFAKQLEALVNEHQLSQWAYVGNSINVPAATPEAQQRMVSIAKHMYAHGCKAIAFVVDSAIAINQLDQIRKELGKENKTSDIIFSDLDDALSYVNSYL